MIPGSFSSALDVGDCMLAQHPEMSGNNLFSQPQHTAPQQDSSKSRSELTLSCFASLLSSAQTSGADDPPLSSTQHMLTKFLSSEWENRNMASFPSLSLKNKISASSVTQEMSLENIAALNLAIPLFASREEITTVPEALLENTSASFMHLVDSRLRSSLAALVQQTLKLGSASASGEAAVLLRLLTSSSTPPIAVTTVVTSFNVLEAQGSQNVMPSFANISPQAEPIMLPLIFDSVIDVKVLGKVITVPFQCPGTIAGLFNHRSGVLDEVEVAFDTIELLKAMMKQARVIVKKAIARAAGIASSIAKNRSLAQTNTAPVSAYSANMNDAATPFNGLSSLPTCGSLAGGSTNNFATLAAMQSFNNLSGSLNVGNDHNRNTSFPTYLAAPNEANILAALAGAGLANGGNTIGNSSSGINIANLPQHLQNAISSVSKNDNFDNNSLQQIPEESTGQEQPQDCTNENQDAASRNSHTHHRDLFSWLRGSDMLLKEGQESAEANSGSASSKNKRKRRSSNNTSKEEEAAMPPRFFTSSACDAMYAASDMFALTAQQHQEREQDQSGESSESSTTESEDAMPPPEKRRNLG